MRKEKRNDLPHFFTGVNFHWLTELDYKNIVAASQAARKNKISEKYSYLVDAFRNYQFTRMSAMNALDLEKNLKNLYGGNNKIIGMSDDVYKLSKDIYEFVIHTKSTLDKIALFYNERFDLNQKEKSCDFKYKTFKHLLKNIDSDLKTLIQNKEIWLSADSRSSLSIFSMRDEWIHRSYPLPVFVIPIMEDIGLYPIPRDLDKAEIYTIEHYMKLREFIVFHGSSLTNLCNLTVAIALEKELETLKEIEIDGSLLDVTSIGHYHKIRI